MLRSQRILAVRHGESEWNVLKQRFPSEADRYKDGLYKPDCNITSPTGIEQSRQAGRELKSMILQEIMNEERAFEEEFGRNTKENGSSCLSCVIIVSPLRRAIQTYQHILSELSFNDDDLSVTIVVHPAASEVMVDSCDIGTCRLDLEAEFPEMSFGLLSRENWWPGGRSLDETWSLMRQGTDTSGGREIEAMAEKRFDELRLFIRNRTENIVVVVCHSETIWWLTNETKHGERFGIWTRNGEVVDVTEHIIKQQTPLEEEKKGARELIGDRSV